MPVRLEPWALSLQSSTLPLSHCAPPTSFLRLYTFPYINPQIIYISLHQSSEYIHFPTSILRIYNSFPYINPQNTYISLHQFSEYIHFPTSILRIYTFPYINSQNIYISLHLSSEYIHFSTAILRIYTFPNIYSQINIHFLTSILRKTFRSNIP